MPHVVNSRPYRVSVPALGIAVKGNATVELTDDQAELLLRQPANWQPAHPCDECEFVARNQGGLSAHQRTHTQENEQ